MKRRKGLAQDRFEKVRKDKKIFNWICEICGLEIYNQNCLKHRIDNLYVLIILGYIRENLWGLKWDIFKLINRFTTKNILRL